MIYTQNHTKERLFFMLKLYNKSTEISSNLSLFFKNIITNISKPHLNMISSIIPSMISAESVVTSDIAKKLHTHFSDIQFSSITRKLERFFNNDKFNQYSFYNSVISHIIDKYTLKNKNVYISFDHMFCKSSFTVFLLSLRIGKQVIPLFFRCFPGNNSPEAFSLSLIKEGISYIHNLFANKDCKLIFLADRWFNFREILEHINALGDIYCIRTKTNILIEIDNYEDADLIKYISDIEPVYSKSKYFESVHITEFKYPTKLVISKSKNHKEPFYILTNGNVQDAVKHYGYRFGSIEFIFKNCKSNGFYLENSKVRNITAFTTLFTLVCIAILLLTSIGSIYSHRKNSVPNYLKIRNSKKKGIKNRERIISLFNTGLTIFNILVNSYHNFPLWMNFVITDV